MRKLSNNLYRLSRISGKASSKIKDVETLISGDPKKITKRAKRKTIGKVMNKITRTIIKKF